MVRSDQATAFVCHRLMLLHGFLPVDANNDLIPAPGCLSIPGWSDRLSWRYQSPSPKVFSSSSPDVTIQTFCNMRAVPMGSTLLLHLQLYKLDHDKKVSLVFRTVTLSPRLYIQGDEFSVTGFINLPKLVQTFGNAAFHLDQAIHRERNLVHVRRTVQDGGVQSHFPIYESSFHLIFATSQPASLEGLPNEVKLLIMKFLDFRALLRLGQTSKDFHALVSRIGGTPAFVWSSFFISLNFFQTQQSKTPELWSRLLRRDFITFSGAPSLSQDPHRVYKARQQGRRITHFPSFGRFE